MSLKIARGNHVCQLMTIDCLKRWPNLVMEWQCRWKIMDFYDQRKSWWRGKLIKGKKDETIPMGLGFILQAKKPLGPTKRVKRPPPLPQMSWHFQKNWPLSSLAHSLHNLQCRCSSWASISLPSLRVSQHKETIILQSLPTSPLLLSRSFYQDSFQQLEIRLNDLVPSG
jgi:hypothetical protein